MEASKRSSPVRDREEKQRARTQNTSSSPSSPLSAKQKPVKMAAQLHFRSVKPVMTHLPSSSDILSLQQSSPSGKSSTKRFLEQFADRRGPLQDNPSTSSFPHSTQTSTPPSLLSLKDSRRPPPLPHKAKRVGLYPDRQFADRRGPLQDNPSTSSFPHSTQTSTPPSLLSLKDSRRLDFGLYPDRALRTHFTKEPVALEDGEANNCDVLWYTDYFYLCLRYGCRDCSSYNYEMTRVRPQLLAKVYALANKPAFGNLSKLGSKIFLSIFISPRVLET